MIAVAGRAADLAAFAGLAGFPAGADLDRSPRRHSQRAGRADAARPHRAAGPARRDRTSSRDVPLSAQFAQRAEGRSRSRFAPARSIGVVGPSGSGKSTLAKLIQRLYLPNEGQVLLDGADLSQVDPAWLRRHIGVVLQESLLFNRTVHENIAFAQPAMPRAQVIEMARLAGADEFIDKLPEGYDTMIEERGANLSGGQRQRLAIARALSTNPRILIFDEATSALDYESERLIQRNMRRIVKNRTVVIIAHRLAAVRGCHRIVGMVDGRIVEVGHARGAVEASRRALRASLGTSEPTGRDFGMNKPAPAADGERAAGAPTAKGRQRVPRARARNSRDPAVAGSRRADLDHLRAGGGVDRLGVFRPDRHHRGRAGQVPADRPRQGDRTAGDRQGRGAACLQRLSRRGGRRPGRVRPLVRRGGRAIGPGGPGFLARRGGAARRGAEAAPARQFDPAPTIAWPDDTPPALRAREQRVFAADLGQVAAAPGLVRGAARAKTGRARSTPR